ncbi:DUF4352 domain-containing protein [Paractinoplanes rhizophilus]|uniref:DUF4352 domain-containing protein n=1 Tax=Paractinoplanes rhizophilus TaxID=1416877 RepID=A0ABW2I593_9ACTN
MDELNRLAYVGLALVSLATIAACGGSGSSADLTPTGSLPAVAQSASTPATAPTSPSTSPRPAESSKLKVGGTFVGERSKITVRSAKLGGSAAEYEPGTVWLYTDVRICNTGTDALSTPSWSMWILKTQDGYEVKPADITPEPRQPALPYDSEIAPSDCVRGWLTFAPPKKSVMKEIRLVEDDLAGTGGIIASWQAG